MTQQNSPIRGAIRTSVSTSTDGLVAGQNFSIFVTVQNPFEVPLLLHRVSTALPTEFIDIDKAEREQQIAAFQDELSETADAARTLGFSTPVVPRRRRKLPGFLRSVEVSVPGARMTYSTGGSAVARDISTSADANLVPLMGGLKAAVAVTKNALTDEEKNTLQQRIDAELAAYRTAIDSLQVTSATPTTLQAGNSTTRVFTLRSVHGIWFRPASYRFHIEVEYEIAGTKNIDTIEHVLQVKSSLTSMIMGALLGGVAGWFTARGDVKPFNLQTAMSLAVSLVFAAMAVVLFARKKDVQPIIAIEDFWGGVAIGFLIAYSGPKLFATLIGAPGTAPSVPTGTPAPSG